MYVIRRRKISRYFIFLLLVIILLSFTSTIASAENLTIEIDYSGENWDFLRWYEIINIDEEGNADIRCVVSFVFTNSTVTSDYKLIVHLNKNIENINVNHPFYETANDYLFNYSINELADETTININFSQNEIDIIQYCQFSFDYSISNVLEKKSIVFEQPIHWEFVTEIDKPNSFHPDFNIFIVLPKNARIDYGNVYLNHPSEIPESNFNILHSYSWNWTSIGTNNIDVKIPDVKDNTIVHINKTYFPNDGKIIINYNTPNLEITIFGVIGLFAGIIGSLFGGVGGYYSYKAYKKRKENTSKYSYEKCNTISIITKKQNNVFEYNKIDRLDSLSLAVPSIFGILGILIPLFGNALAGNENNIGFVNEILYYFTIPLLFFAVAMPLYIGYWRGAITKNLIIERIRGWIYLLLGTLMYLIPTLLLTLSLVITILFPTSILIILIVNLVILIICSYILIKFITNFHPFVKRLFKIYNKEISLFEEYIVIRTYISATTFGIFFYVLFYSITIGKFILSEDLLYAPIRLIGMGLPLIIFGLNSEKDTIEYIDNMPIIEEKIVSKNSWLYSIKMLVALSVSIVFLILYLLYGGPVYSFLLHLCIGFTLYYFLKFVMEKILIRYLKKSNDIKNFSINKLNEIKGIGQETIKKLEDAGIQKIEELDNMTLDNLISINGIGKSLAQKIFYNFQKFK
jgi:hypothetical protein